MVAAYLSKVGLDLGLLALAKTIKFEDMHVLTREEIARFGLDRRDFVETPWKFESSGRGMMHKVAFVRGQGETSFRTIHWQVVCFDADRFALGFLRPAPVSSSPSSVSIVGGDARPVDFGYPPKRVSGLEQWVLRMPRAAIQSLLNAPQVEFAETSPAADGRQLPNTIKLSNEGFAFAMNSLMATCPPARDSSPRQATGVPGSVSK